MGTATGIRQAEALRDRLPDGTDTLVSSPLLRRHPDATVALVAHGFVAKVIRAIALDERSDLFDWQLDNAHYCELQLGLPLSRFDNTLDDIHQE
ncbi:hypothetical protein HW090_16420 [Pseudomonas sp. ABC1]|uniref:hypothetical protein n=1 Tax=Pseudomonas sp. ABC1 TaxID=2748080 RepID=UPI0015C362C3|nr:hypothetical protein [Pseudomonas sp. ABC1]QLF94696.1 hypothetical protein HW090_16420 [Pseudomonas sp. ABC1]